MTLTLVQGASLARSDWKKGGVLPPFFIFPHSYGVTEPPILREKRVAMLSTDLSNCIGDFLEDGSGVVRAGLHAFGQHDNGILWCISRVKT